MCVTVAHSDYYETEAYVEETAEDTDEDEKAVTQTGDVTTEEKETEESNQKGNRQKKAEKEKQIKNENSVYVTPYGKRYHYSKSCAGKNAIASTKSNAINDGKTPCKKCAGG